MHVHNDDNRHMKEQRYLSCPAAPPGGGNAEVQRLFILSCGAPWPRKRRSSAFLQDRENMDAYRERLLLANKSPAI